MLLTATVAISDKEKEKMFLRNQMQRDIDANQKVRSSEDKKASYFHVKTYSLITLLPYSLQKQLDCFVTDVPRNDECPQCPRALVTSKRAAFTLAEVLITLGIIGVIAALTIPALIENHRKVVVSAKLKKFYTVMSQAIIMSENENGEYSNWAPDADMAHNADELEEWFNKYLGNYIYLISKKKTDASHFQVGFKDGSGFNAYIGDSGAIPIFYCVTLKYCGVEKYDGKNSFLFNISTNGKFDTYCSSCTREQMLENCKYGNWYSDESLDINGNRRHCCAALIKHDGWEIKKDYPWKQTTLKNE